MCCFCLYICCRQSRCGRIWQKPLWCCQEALLSVGHAKVLLGVEDQQLQEYLCDLVIKDDLSVRQLEEKIKKLSQKKSGSEEQGQDLPEEYFKVLEIVGKYFENDISLKRSTAGKGTMTIHFSSDEEVRKFLTALEESKF